MFEAVFRLIIILGILVFVHEFGHFIIAKLVGIRVDRFSLGFPPRMFGKKIGETDYCISWIPLGGYVKMAGMIDESMDSESITGAPDEFMSKPVYQRFFVIFAGPLMNILLAAVLFGAVAHFVGLKDPEGLVIDKFKSEQIKSETGLLYGDEILTLNEHSVKTWEDIQNALTESDLATFTVRRDTHIVTTSFNSKLIDSLQFSLPPVVGSLKNDSPAMKAGMQKGDRIIAIGENQIKNWNDMTDIIHAHAGDPLLIIWEHDGQRVQAEIIPDREKIQGKEVGLIGISYPVQVKKLAFFESVSYGFEYSWYITRLTYHYVKLVVRGERSFKDAFGGPIMIAKMARDSAREGESNFIIFLAFISLNLGLINLLPVPVLDGGHIVFLLIEAVIRRPVPDKAKLIIQQVGMVILLAFMLFVIFNDISRIW
ncbi:RIP metalloprotease RseP [candidate division KSB1 bacterium 4572_119]|nr:MAG: RIP metalloprotease RseP [candidate division KSB1 bacterium 4572_119]